jgi:hypothetical protein
MPRSTTCSPATCRSSALYDPGLAGWRDLREPDRDWAAASWCHGAGGIGIAALSYLDRAAGHCDDRGRPSP